MIKQRYVAPAALGAFAAGAIVLRARKHRAEHVHGLKRFGRKH